jgi:hypothetical protein
METGRHAGNATGQLTPLVAASRPHPLPASESETVQKPSVA